MHPTAVNLPTSGVMSRPQSSSSASVRAMRMYPFSPKVGDQELRISQYAWPVSSSVP